MSPSALLRQERQELSAALDSLLLETAFDNRYVLHPRRLRTIGGELADALVGFYDAPDPAAASAYGEALAREGLGEKTVLQVASQFRRFCARLLGGSPAALQNAELFTTALLEGFLGARVTQVITDQEQLRKALSAALASQSQELVIKNLAVNTSVNGIMLTDLGGKLTWVNASFLRLWGCGAAEQALGRSFGGFWADAEPDRILDIVLSSGGWHGQLRARRVDGGVFSAELSASLIRDEQQDPVGIMASVVDITERLKAEEMEKNLLLAKEIHHRIKNNLQVISSLLFLQSEYVRDSQTREMFKESQNRVRSMALLHQKLYQSKSLAGVQASEYLRDLTANLLGSYGLSDARIRLEVRAEEITLGMDTAVPCGLILNELVSNSLKHAFPSGGPGEIRVELSRRRPPAGPQGEGGHGYRLVVADNGVGFPAGLDFRNTESLGLKIVCTLTAQLGGTIELARDGGSTFTILFREA